MRFWLEKRENSFWVVSWSGLEGNSGKGVTVIKWIKGDKSDWYFAAFGVTRLCCQSGVGSTARSEEK
jgi:hypothetical protein